MDGDKRKTKLTTQQALELYWRNIREDESDGGSEGPPEIEDLDSDEETGDEEIASDSDPDYIPEPQPQPQRPALRPPAKRAKITNGPPEGTEATIEGE